MSKLLTCLGERIGGKNGNFYIRPIRKKLFQEISPVFQECLDPTNSNNNCSCNIVSLVGNKNLTAQITFSTCTEEFHFLCTEKQYNSGGDKNLCENIKYTEIADGEYFFSPTEVPLFLPWSFT